MKKIVFLLLLMGGWASHAQSFPSEESLPCRIAGESKRTIKKIVAVKGYENLALQLAEESTSIEQDLVKTYFENLETDIYNNDFPTEIFNGIQPPYFCEDIDKVNADFHKKLDQLKKTYLKKISRIKINFYSDIKKTSFTYKNNCKQFAKTLSNLIIKSHTDHNLTSRLEVIINDATYQYNQCLNR